MRFLARGLLLILLTGLGAGTAHTEPSAGVHLDVSANLTFVPGPSPNLQVRVEITNPSVQTFRYGWFNGCYLDWHITTPTRTLLDTRNETPRYCTQALVSLEVPPQSSRVLTGGNLGYYVIGVDECATIRVFLVNTTIWGAATSCPGPEPPSPPGVLVMRLVLPSAVHSGATFTAVAEVLSSDALPIPGATVVVTTNGTTHQRITDAEGRASFSLNAPPVVNVQLMGVTAEAFLADWQPSLWSGAVAVFPPEARWLLITYESPTGDLVESNRTMAIVVTIEDDRGWPVTVSPQVGVLGPLQLVRVSQLSQTTWEVTVTADSVEDLQAASVRVVANATGVGGAELVIDLLVIPQEKAADGGDGGNPPPAAEGVGLAALAFFILLFGVMGAVLLAARRSRS